MKTTHLLTIKARFNINCHSPRMIIAKDTMLEVYEEPSGEIVIPLGGRFSLELCVSKKDFEGFLKYKIFEIVQVHLERERTDA